MSDVEDVTIRARGPATAHRSDPLVRAWVLLLLDGTTRTGLSPISKLRFHRLAYFTNCMARLFGLQPADERIVKFRRGPYYPTLQWHLDRLVGLSLAQISSIRHFTDSSGPWMDANYGITRGGVSVVNRLCEIRTTAALRDFLLELSKAYASQTDDALDELILADVTYEDPRHGLGTVIDFRRIGDNLSVQAAESFAKFAEAPLALTVEDELHLYTEYLDRRRAKGQLAR